MHDAEVAWASVSAHRRAAETSTARADAKNTPMSLSPWYRPSVPTSAAIFWPVRTNVNINYRVCELVKARLRRGLSGRKQSKDRVGIGPLWMREFDAHRWGIQNRSQLPSPTERECLVFAA